MRDSKYSIEIMKMELSNKYISPEILYAFKNSIEALEKQIPTKTTFHQLGDYIGLNYCKVCNDTVCKEDNYCSYCGQKLDWN